MTYTGILHKMRVEFAHPVQYFLHLGGDDIAMNALLGKSLRLTWKGVINCIACGRKTNKSFNQGHCYPCFKSKAHCDICIVKPELCHYDSGTCRDPEWGKEHCFQPHYVYLANSSGVKVGITRHTQIPTRWIDQGAVQALPIIKVRNRLQSGQVEMIMKNYLSDKTSWQRMLKSRAEKVDLKAIKTRVLEQASKQLKQLQKQIGEAEIEILKEDSKGVTIHFPVDHYPEKVKSFNLDKTPEISSVLQGIKAQYLIFDNGVINIRKFAGYHITLEQY